MGAGPNFSLSQILYKYPRGLAKNAKSNSYYLWSTLSTYGLVIDVSAEVRSKVYYRPNCCSYRAGCKVVVIVPVLFVSTISMVVVS